MAKWADYVITGVWFGHKNGSSFVEYVRLGKDNGESIDYGEKTHKNTVISLLDKGYSVVTSRWQYGTAKFRKGALVHVVKDGNERYLRSNHDKETGDNLDNMYDLTSLG